MSDAGLTHVAVECTDLDRTIDFFGRYGNFEVVHRRDGIAWISDRTRPFAIVLAEAERVRPVGPFSHLGIACADRATFDRLVTKAREENVLRTGPSGDDGPAGRWAFLDDPDGNTVELSLGQSVQVAVEGGPIAMGARRLPVIGVMGGRADPMPEFAEPLGRAIARGGWHVLTGGGVGIMMSVGRGFVETAPRAGLCIGILRGESDGRPLEGYPNPFVEVPIFTHLPAGDDGPDSRNHLNILSSTVILALPGGDGTRSEIDLALRYGRPVAIHRDWATSYPEIPSFETVEESVSILRRLLASSESEGATNA